ncbi:sensor histidine kinase [Rheinheimera riviphila]|nr:histidine kinase dimerization/phospho-acceptor domain-containing protein [Rheinheimera riviphila]
MTEAVTKSAPIPAANTAAFNQASPAISLSQRIVRSFVLLALCCGLLFSLVNLIFVYTVEDQFFYHQLKQEQRRQLQHATTVTPVSPLMQLYFKPTDFPKDIVEKFQQNTRAREIPGEAGRHYHLLKFDHPAHQVPVWLVMEVSQQLVVRPIRTEMLLFYGFTTLLMLAAAAVIGIVLSRRATRPLLELVQLVQQSQHTQSQQTQSLPKGFAANFRDNEIGLLARTLEQAFDRLQQFVERERAFSRDASHELRTPLSLIQSSAELLLLQPDLPTAAQQKLQQITAACLQMTQLINTLLTLSREQALPESVDSDKHSAAVPLLPLLEQLVIQHSDLLLRQHLTIDLQLAENTSPLLVHKVSPVLLQMILANLLQNACSHSLPGEVLIAADAQGLLISNPLNVADLPLEPAALFAKGRHSSGYGVGLGIVQRLCQHSSIGLAIALNADKTRLEVRLSWPL